MYLVHSLFLAWKIELRFGISGERQLQHVWKLPSNVWHWNCTCAVYGHHESPWIDKNLQGKKKCVSGHWMSLTMTTRKSPSLTGNGLLLLHVLRRWHSAVWGSVKNERLTSVSKMKGRHKGVQWQGTHRHPKLWITDMF